MTLRLSVPPRYRRVFWKWAPSADIVWMFRTQPQCTVDDEILFVQDRRPVAAAKVIHIDPPGQWYGITGEGRRKGTALWKVHWNAGSFEDLREDEREEWFTPQLYGGYAP